MEEKGGWEEEEEEEEVDDGNDSATFCSGDDHSSTLFPGLGVWSLSTRRCGCWRGAGDIGSRVGRVALSPVVDDSDDEDKVGCLCATSLDRGFRCLSAPK